MYRNLLLSLLVICLSSVSILSEDNNSKYIIVGNKVNIRDQPTLNSKVISQCNFGDQVQLMNVPENESKMGDQKNFFYKVSINGVKGWVNRLYVTDNYSYNPTLKYYCYSVLVNLDGVTNDNTINVYYSDTKQFVSRQVNVTSIVFIDSGKFCFNDSGSDVFRSHEFIELPSFKVIKKASVFGIGKVINNTVVFNETKKISTDKYESVETIFENGIFKKTGKTEIVKEP